MSLLNALNGMNASQKISGQGVIEAENHHGITANDRAAHLHRSDVDVVLAED